MATTSTPSGARSRGQVTKLNRLLEDILVGALDEAPRDSKSLQHLLNRGGDFKAYVLHGVRRFSSAAPDWTLARTILGNDFLSPEEVMAARKGLVYSAEQITALGQSLPTRQELEWLRDHDYFLVPAPTSPQSLAEHRTSAPDYFRSDNTWFLDARQKFSGSDKTGGGWLAIKKTIVHGSTAKSCANQQLLLSGVEHVPNTAEFYYGITTYFRVRSARLFPNIYARTSSVDRDGGRVYVGCGGDGAPSVDGWCDKPHDVIGLAASRKFGN